MDTDSDNPVVDNICNTDQEGNTNNDVSHEDIFEETRTIAAGEENTSNTNVASQKVKRTSKRRPTQHNKSIIQSAIARKEKSFEDYLKPKNKTTKVNKTKEVSLENNEDAINSSTPVKKSVSSSPSKSLVSNKKLRKKDSGTSKNDLEIDSMQMSLEPEPSLRRSQRTLSSDNKGAFSTVDNSSNVDNLLKAQLESRLCKCTENKEIFMETDSESLFCTAVDSISDKLIGCSRLVDVKTVPMRRPSTRIPFSVFCDVHIQRLIKHNCCPTCGVFCTQGQFAECTSKHQFHKDCQLSIGNLKYCPHCGDSTKSKDVLVSMHSPKKPIFLPVQRSHQ